MLRSNAASQATCHEPGKAFGDGLARAKGHGGNTLDRNTPGLLNAGLYSTYLWDGRAESLTGDPAARSARLAAIRALFTVLGRLLTELGRLDAADSSTGS